MNAPVGFDAGAVQRHCADIVHALPGIEWITDARVERLSQDFYWFSPVLQRQLSGLRADAVARPTTEDAIRAVVAACAQRGVPITPRGSGTGNYGQCMPRHGGVVLDLSAYKRLLWCRGGVARAEAGIRLGELDRQTQQVGAEGEASGNGLGWELRCVPSTVRSATLGGLYGGGFGGVGSINHGPLAAPGNVLGLKAMTVEPEPRTVELRAPEALLLHHAYGCNGLVLELEVALAPAHPWLEAIVCFDDFDAALTFADTLAGAPGLVKKSVSLFAAPVAGLLLRALPHLAGAMLPGAHAVPVLVAESAEGGMQHLAAQHGGRVTFRKTAAETAASRRTLVETTWNHTTLHALKVERTLTYIQSGFAAGQHLQQVRTLHAHFGDEVLQHLEWIRNTDGALTCAGLQLVRYSTDERLQEIMQTHRDHGVGIADPHVWVVEDGKQGQINPAVVEMKRRLDPQGLLNPGKLRGWEERDALPADARSVSTLPRF